MLEVFPDTIQCEPSSIQCVLEEELAHLPQCYLIFFAVSGHSNCIFGLV
jgi:hypothetical protein